MSNPTNTHKPGHLWTDEEWKARHVASIVRSIPQGYDDLSPDLIAEAMHHRGVRRLNLDIDDGGPTQQLRNLIAGLRHGTSNTDDLDTALNILETRLNVPLTNADDAA